MLFEFAEGTSTMMVVVQVVQICVTSLLGIYAIAAALNGFMVKRLNALYRVIVAAGGLCMMIPGTFTDIIGLVLVAGVYVILKASLKKQAAA